MKLKFLQNPGPRAQLFVALLLGLGFLAVCVWWSLADLMAALATDKVTASLVYGQVLGPVLTDRLLWFALALLVLHLAFGLLAFGLARLTAAALPGVAASRPVRL